MKFRTSVDLAWNPSGSRRQGGTPTLSHRRQQSNTPCGCLLFGVSSCRCSDIDSSPSSSITRSLNRSQVYLSAFVCLSFSACSCFCFSVFPFLCLSASLFRSPLFCLFWLFFLPSACSAFCLCLLVDFLLVCPFAFLHFRLAASLLFSFSACMLRYPAPPLFCSSASVFSTLIPSGLVLLRFSPVHPSGFMLLRNTK